MIIYVHGAGWVFGNSHTHDRLIRELADRTGAAVVFPNYSLSPEARYPTAIEEIYAVLEWVAAEGAGHKLDGRRIVIAGDSVGGNMAAAVTLMAKLRSGPHLAAQVLFYPVTDASFESDSYHQLRGLNLGGDRGQRLLSGLIRLTRRLERMTRPRFASAFGGRASNVLFAALVILGAAAAFAAPPLSGLDTLPSLSVVVLSLGLFEDALVVAAAIALGAAAISALGAIG